ncbi:MAG: DoxX family protein [Pyrinomonadaceae bacterium]
MGKIRTASRVIFGVLFILAGLNHFIDPAFYLKIMPPYLPWHVALVLISGAAESLLGVMLLMRRFERWAAWGLISLLIAVFPANVYMVQHSELFPDIPVVALWLRLPLQAVLILWAYIYTRPARG